MTPTANQVPITQHVWLQIAQKSFPYYWQHWHAQKGFDTFIIHPAQTSESVTAANHDGH
ncbi:MAG: hypothetical protein V3R25_06255 [Nitrosomonadaceae bacterium]